MAPQHEVRFSVQLPGETLVFPSRPLEIADGDYFIWPFHFDMDGVDLRYATAQPVARIDQGKDGVVYVFAAHKTLPVEFAFDAQLASAVHGAGATASQRDGQLVVDGFQPGTGEAITVQRPGAGPVRIVVLSFDEAQHLTLETLAGRRRLLLTDQQAVLLGGALQLRSVGKPDFHLGVFPPLAKAPRASSPLAASGKDGIFQTFDAHLPERRISATVTPVREAGKAPPIAIGGPAHAAVQPAPESFKVAASWKVSIPREQLKGLDDALLDIDFVGDFGRLYSGVHMLDDWYYSGYGWQFGLKGAQAALDQPLTVSVMPLRADAPIYIPKQGRPDFGTKTQIAELRGVSVTPVYLLELKP
jgi:hypothetical protein